MLKGALQMSLLDQIRLTSSPQLRDKWFRLGLIKPYKTLLDLVGLMKLLQLGIDLIIELLFY